MRDRLQLLSASLCIALGYSETFSFYRGMLILIPLFGFAIALLNVIFARFYQMLTERLGDKFELLLLRLNGVIMVITGLGYHLFGSRYIQYAYYLISILYFVVLPKIVLPVKKRRLSLHLTDSGMTITTLTRSVVWPWESIVSAHLLDNVLEIKRKGHNRTKHFYLEISDPAQRDELDHLLQRVVSSPKTRPRGKTGNL